MNETGVVFHLILGRQLIKNIPCHQTNLPDIFKIKCNYQLGLHQKFVNDGLDLVTYITEILG